MHLDTILLVDVRFIVFLVMMLDSIASGMRVGTPGFGMYNGIPPAYVTFPSPLS